MSWLKKNGLTLILLLILLIGAGLIAYPSFANWWNSFHQSRAVASYAETAANMNTEEYERIISKSQAYNRKLSRSGILWTLDEDEEKEYKEQLDIGTSGIMGYIDIPKIDLNKADSAAFETLPGIGPFYAAKIVEYRDKLGGSYSYPEQLMDLYRFDREKFDKVSDLVTVTGAKPYRLWTLPEDSLAMHPYIRKYAAHGIVLYRNNHSPSQWTVKGLEEAGVLRSEDAGKLGKCVIATP